MKPVFSTFIFIAGVFASAGSYATGLATCESGKPESWQPQEKLQKMLADKGWNVRRIKIDGGCYEVYALNDKGERASPVISATTRSAAG